MIPKIGNCDNCPWLLNTLNSCQLSMYIEDAENLEFFFICISVTAYIFAFFYILRGIYVKTLRNTIFTFIILMGQIFSEGLKTII